MKVSKNQKILAIVSIFVLLISVALMLIDFFTEFSFGYHPLLTFVFSLTVGFGIMCLALGLAKKSSWQFFLSAVLLGLASLYIFIIYIEMWWICLVLLAVIWGVLAIVCFMIGGNKTEDIALNEKEDYKDYKQRREEKKIEEEFAPKEELPKVKSFKD